MLNKLTNFILLTIFSILYLTIPTINNFIFISLSPQLYVPGKRYSTLTISYNVEVVRNPRFDINISLSLDQVNYYIIYKNR